MDRRFTPIAAMLLASVTVPTLFQDACAQTASADSATLPEISVTGSVGSPVKVDNASSSKFTAPLLDLPKSVTVINSEVINQTGSTALVEALRTTPGITFGAGEGGNPVGDHPFIRGFDAQSSTYVDGMRDLGSQSREIFNVESVEVVKGASSAYGGGGSTGGSVNLVSKAPMQEQFSAGSVAIGTDDYRRVTADGNYLLGDNAAVRLNAMYHDAGVAGRDAIYDKRWGFAPSLTLGLNTPTRVTLSYYHMQTDGLPDSGIPYNNPKTSDARNGNGSPYQVDRNNFYGLADRDFRKTQADIATVRVEHDVGARLHLRNTTRYSKTSNDYIWTQPDDSQGNTYNGLVWRRANTRISDVESMQNQTELFGEFLAGSVKHNFSMGVEMSRAEATSDSYHVRATTGATACASGAGAASNYDCTSLYQPNPADPWRGYIGRANRPTEAVNTAYSVYLFDHASMNEQWSINAGLRYDSYRSSSRTPAYPAISAAASPTGAAIAVVAASDLHNKSSFLNYQAGVVFKPAANGSVYVNYSTASDPAGLNANDGTSDGAISAANQNLAPERSRSYELGSKWDVMDDRLSLTAAIFRTEKTNARITAANGTTRLAGNYKVDGMELGFAGNVTAEWQVFGGYTFMNSRVVDTTSFSRGVVNVSSGKQFANIPRNSFSLWSTYLLMPRLTVGSGAFYTSRVYGNTMNTKWVPGYTRFDAMASYVIDKNMTFQLNVQNLTDKAYYSQAYASHYASIAPGRSATLALNVKY
ncbi:MAG: TonB-dependent siderophore receptor [Herbaspirillum sp.]